MGNTCGKNATDVVENNKEEMQSMKTPLIPKNSNPSETEKKEVSLEDWSEEIQRHNKKLYGMFYKEEYYKVETPEEEEQQEKESLALFYNKWHDHGSPCKVPSQISLFKVNESGKKELGSELFYSKNDLNTFILSKLGTEEEIKKINNSALPANMNNSTELSQ